MAKSTKPLHLRARDFLMYRSRTLRGWLKHGLWRRVVPHRPQEPIRLHVGSGMQRLEGWVNLDIQKLPEVDFALDIRTGLPFADVELVFAEHFLEHLDVDVAVGFLAEVRRVLRPEGWLRLSTPNLDWVWTHLYSPNGGDDGTQVRSAIHANRAFYGWRHRFLWNRPLLERALAACGFRDVRFCRYGESELEALRGLERHETYDDTDELPHVLIAEARPGEADPDALAALLRELDDHFLNFRSD